MEAALTYIVTGTRGAPARVRILHALLDQPQTLSSLAAASALTGDTVSEHLPILLEHELIELDTGPREPRYRIAPRVRDSAVLTALFEQLD